MILVFGGTGQLGSALAGATRGQARVAALSRVDADITDAAAVARAIERWRPRLVVNAAAYNKVDEAETRPGQAFRINTNGPRIVAECCAAVDLPLIHVSTDFVFDGAKGAPYREDDRVAPLSVYAQSKAEGEVAVREALPRHLILRTAWLFGGGPGFVGTVVDLAARHEPLRFVADQYGSPTAAGDLARAILIAARAISLGDTPWGTYHVAGATRASRWEMAVAVVAAQARVTGLRPTVGKITAAEFGAAAPRPPNSVLDSSRFAARFGYRAGDWRTEIDRAVELLLTRRTAA